MITKHFENIFLFHAKGDDRVGQSSNSRNYCDHSSRTPSSQGKDCCIAIQR